VDRSFDEISIEPIGRLEDVRQDWTRLAEGSGHPFATWEWNSLWWQRFGEGRELHSFACRDRHGETLAILPLYVASTRPVRLARFLGYADLQSPVCEPRHRDLAAWAMLELTRDRDGCRAISAERLPADQGWGERLGGRLTGGGPDPALRFEGRGWEEFLASKSRNFRQQVRRRERRLVDEHGLSFRLADDPERLPSDMEALFRLHGARWGERSTGVFEGSRGEFYRDFAGVALRCGWLRLWIAEIDGEPVAAWYGVRFAGSEWYFQAGRVQRFDDLSLGFVLLVHTIREACQAGVESYRFLAGGEEYKWRFANDDPGSESRVVTSGALAGMAALGISTASKMPGPVKRRIARAIG
jgi:CelD/BcsL family acetyltransferase involved in cellulose biosynthesis